MNKNKVLFKILSVVSCVLVLGTVSLAASYTDTEGHWANEAIERWTEYKIVEGYGEDIFKPDGNMTRAELAQVIDKLLELKNKNDSKFSDVDNEKWFYDAISACSDAGIVKGRGDNNFDPDSLITREEAMVMLGRALNVKPDEEVKLDDYKDAKDVSEWAENLISAMVSKKIVQGVGEGNLKPKDNVKRAEVLEIMNNTISTYIAEDGEYEVKDEENKIVLVVAKDVTIKGESKGDIIITQGAEDSEIRLDGIVNNGEIYIAAEDSKIILNDKSEVDKINVIGDSSTLVIEKGAKVENIEVKAENTEISGKGEVASVDVMDGAKNTTVKTEKTEVRTSKDSENTVAGDKEVTPGDKVVTKAESSSNPGGSDKPVEPEKTYKVTYDANGGVNAGEEEITVKENEKVAKPEDPTREGYKFMGWYLVDELYNFESTITEDISLKAMWKFEIKDQASFESFASGKYGEADILEAGIITEDITLSSKIEISRDLEIDGNEKILKSSDDMGLTLILVSSNAKLSNIKFDLESKNTRALYITNLEKEEAILVELTNVTIENSKLKNSGSAIATEGLVDLTLDGCVIKNNVTEADAEGKETAAAIYFGNVTGTLTLINTEVTNNNAYGSTGGIWIASTAKLIVKEGCTITGNTISENDTYCSDCKNGVDIFLNANKSGAGENKGALATIEGGTIGIIHVEDDKGCYAILTLKGGAVEKIHGFGNNSTLVIDEGASYQEGENALTAGEYKWNPDGEGLTKWGKQVTVEVDNAKLDEIVEGVLGFKASALQEVTIENGKANGTLKYISEEDGKWNQNIWPENELTGNYLVLFVEEATMEDFEVTCELTGGKNGKVKLDSDGIYIVRLTTVEETKITITLKNTKLNTETKYEIDLSELNLDSKE